MTVYLIRRLLLMIPTLVGMTMVVFFVTAMTPGGIAGSLISQDLQLRPEERKAREAYLNERYDLKKPLIVQYFKWLNKVLPLGFKKSGVGWPGRWWVGFKPMDLGESFYYQRPVGQMINEALPISILLEAISLPLIYLIAVGSGIRAAQSRGKLVDIGLGFTLLALFSMPEIWIGVLLIVFLTNREELYLFPTNGLHDTLSDSMLFLPHWIKGHFERGYVLDALWHLVLPVWCLSYGAFAFLSRLTRGSLLETLGMDFVRTARAKGLNEQVVLYRHAFRNSLISLITASSGLLVGFVSGSVIVENIFGIRGMGKLAVDAALNRDKELLLSITLIVSFLQLVGFLLTDIAYVMADPRVSYAD